MGIKKQNSKPNCISERHSNNCPDKGTSCATLDIIGFNFDYSAYEHGS